MKSGCEIRVHVIHFRPNTKAYKREEESAIDVDIIGNNVKLRTLEGWTWPFYKVGQFNNSKFLDKRHQFIHFKLHTKVDK